MAQGHQVFHPVLKSIRRPGCASMGHDQLAGHATDTWGQPNLPLALKKQEPYNPY